MILLTKINDSGVDKCKFAISLTFLWFDASTNANLMPCSYSSGYASPIQELKEQESRMRTKEKLKMSWQDGIPTSRITAFLSSLSA